MTSYPWKLEKHLKLDTLYCIYFFFDILTFYFLSDLKGEYSCKGKLLFLTCVLVCFVIPRRNVKSCIRMLDSKQSSRVSLKSSSGSLAAVCVYLFMYIFIYAHRRVWVGLPDHFTTRLVLWLRNELWLEFLNLEIQSSIK